MLGLPLEQILAPKRTLGKTLLGPMSMTAVHVETPEMGT